MNLQQEIGILHLARWYPNRMDAMLGLFVKRHAEAVAINLNSYVITVHPVRALSQLYELEISRNNNLLEIVIYYRDIHVHIPIITEILKAFRFYMSIYKGYKYLKNNDLKFHFVHVHVLTRMGIAARFIQLFTAIPYGISEHWSRYLPRNKGFTGIIRKYITRRIVAKAAFVSTVTENLHQAMLSHKLLNPNYFVLPNVVNPSLFGRKMKPDDVFTFIHISTFEDKSKNISGILHTISELILVRNDFKFVFVGDGQDFTAMKNLASDLKLPKEMVRFTGLLENQQLGETLQSAHCLVLFSNYENFPVVINESLSFGVPVLSTHVGGISEVINSSNGVLIEAGNRQALYKEMRAFLDGKYSFDNQQIKLDFEDRFSISSISKLLLERYIKCLETKVH